jgi:hypothetical protein
MLKLTVTATTKNDSGDYDYPKDFVVKKIT